MRAPFRKAPGPGPLAGTASARQSRRKGFSTFFSANIARWSGALVCLVVIITILGPLIAPYSPIDFIDAPFAPPSSVAWLGTDIIGRDVLSRVLCGGLNILSLSAISTFFGVLAGTALGILAGYVKGVWEEAIMRTLDIFLAFPQMILALLFISVLDSSSFLIVVLISAIHAPQVARVIRAATLNVASQDYVEFAESIGLSRSRIMVSEILPNVLAPILVEFGLRFTYSIAIIASLSFLGLAQQPPAANWGLMINENRIGLMQNPMAVLAPVVLIGILTVGVNLLCDAYARYSSSGATVREVTVDDDPSLSGAREPV